MMTEKITSAGEYADPEVQKYENDDGTAASLNEITARGYTGNVGQTKANWRRFTTRHHHGGNLLFADGHVAWFSWREVQIPLGSGYSGSRSDANQPGLIIWSAVGPVN